MGDTMEDYLKGTSTPTYLLPPTNTDFHYEDLVTTLLLLLLFWSNDDYFYVYSS